MAKLKQKMVGLDPECILIKDEAALFYQLAPTCSYVLECDARETRGTELQRSKARVTLVICVNATGTLKSIAVIHNVGKPVCFRCQTDLPVRYDSQKKGWMDSTVYAKWLADLSKDWGAFTSRHGFLIMDNTSGHDASATDNRFDIDLLPPNVTARFQPCDQGDINATKTTYRRGMMLGMLTAFDDQFDESAAKQEARKAREARARAGSLGMAEGPSPHVLDAIRLVKAAIDTVTPTATMRCWLRASCTPPDVHAKSKARLDAAVPAATEPAAVPVDDASREIVGMLARGRSLGPKGGGIYCQAGSDAGGELLVSGAHPDALSLIAHWLGEERSPASVFSVIDAESQTE